METVRKQSNLIGRIHGKVERELLEHCQWYMGEKHRCYGSKNRDKKFYIIRRNDACGLGSYIITNVRLMKYAMDNGYIPLVDMMNYHNAYNADTYKEHNVWEYYFEQPLNKYSLEDAYRSKNVLLSDIRIPKHKDGEPDFTMNFMGNTAVVQRWSEFTRKYLRLNEKTNNYIDEVWNNLVKNDDRVIGIVLRGTDYVTSRPKNHPIQPTVEQMVKKVQEVMVEQSCNKVFLATEDLTYRDAVCHEFGDAVIENPKPYVKYTGGGINGYSLRRDNDGYMRGLEYLTTMVCLSKCNCLVAGRCGASVVALMLSEGYEYTYLFDFGVY